MLHRRKIIVSILMILIMIVTLAPNIFAGPPSETSNAGYYWDCYGSWDCYWWAKFFNIVEDIITVMTV